jgi:hypothetical protein
MIDPRKRLGGLADAAVHISLLADKYPRYFDRVEAVYQAPGVPFPDPTLEEFAQNVGTRFLPPAEAYRRTGVSSVDARSARAKALALMRRPEIWARIEELRVESERTLMQIYEDDYGGFWEELENAPSSDPG